MTTWTAERDQRILLLLLNDIKPDFKRLAAKWKKNYVDVGIDQYEPTALALSKHIAALRERLNKCDGVSPETPAKQLTPRSARAAKKSSLPKTPTPSRKRKRQRRADSDDDSEEVISDPVVSEEEAMSDIATTDSEGPVYNTPVSLPRRTSTRVPKSSPDKLEADAKGGFDNLDSEEDSLESEVSSFSDVDAD